MDANDTRARLALGNALSRAGDTEAAVREYRIATQTDPGNTLALERLAIALIADPSAPYHDPVTAVRLAERSWRLDSGRLRALETLVRAYIASGRLADAVAAAEQGAELATSQGRTEWTKRFQRMVPADAAGGDA
jgi:Flp pilus assembly protein TadD